MGLSVERVVQGIILLSLNSKWDYPVCNGHIS